MDPLEAAALRSIVLLGRPNRRELDGQQNIPGLGELLPGVEVAMAQYSDWLGRTQALGVGVVPGITHDSKSRRRSHLPVLSMFMNWGETVGAVVSIYWRVLPDVVKGKLRYLLIKSGLLRALDSEKLRLSLKDLGGLAKKHQDILFPGYWRFLVDLHVMRDYAVSLDIKEFEDDVTDWVTGDVIHAVDGDEAKFLDGFRRGVFQFLRQGPGHMEEYVPLSVKQFCSDPGYWARSGSSDGPRLTVETADGRKKCRKQKWATAMAMSPAAVETLLRARVLQSNHAVQKRELGKVRAIVAGDLSTYLKMAYVARWLEARMAGHMHSTLFYSGAQLLRLWNRMVTDSQNSYRVKMPVDQSKFDHMVKKVMVKIMNEECERYTREFCDTYDKDELLEVWSLVMWAVSGGWVKVGTRLLWYEKGVVSGWRLTAFYDTLANAGEMNVAREWVTDRIGFNPILEDVYQGDDIELVVVNYSCAILLWLVYRDMGFDVNPSKFFISDNVDEFLRQVTDGNTIHGYPARAVTSLVWRNPVGTEPVRGEERVRELVGSWNVLLSRVGRWDERNTRLMVEDVAGSNKITAELVERILRTPACFGGTGTLPETALPWLGIRKGRRVKQWWMNIPAAATELGLNWGVEPARLADIWSKNIEGPASVVDLYENGELFDVAKLAPVGMVVTPVHGKDPPLVVRLRSGIPPSAATALVEQCIESRDWELLRGYVDITCLAYYDDFKSRLGRSVFVNWLLGRLPFSTPIVLGWSSLAVSAVHEYVSRGVWAWVVSRHRVNSNLVHRAAYTAELHTRGLLDGQPVRVGG